MKQVVKKLIAVTLAAVMATGMLGKLLAILR